MKISQSNLDNYTTNLKITNDTINNIIGANTNNLKNWFNDYWISKRALENAIEIDEILNKYQIKVIDLFNEINTAIKRNIIIQNNKEENEEKIYYNKKSLTQKKSVIANNLNKSLPGDSIGRLQGTADVYYPIEKTKNTIEEIDKYLKILINSCDGISNKSNYKSELQIIKNESFYEIEKIISHLNSIYEN